MSSCEDFNQVDDEQVAHLALLEEEQEFFDSCLAEELSEDWRSLEDLSLQESFPKYAILGEPSEHCSVFCLVGIEKGKGRYWLYNGDWGFQATMTISGPIVSSGCSQIQHLLNKKITPVSKEFYCESLAR